jgi:hypothetical protein
MLRVAHVGPGNAVVAAAAARQHVKNGTAEGKNRRILLHGRCFVQEVQERRWAGWPVAPI